MENKYSDFKRPRNNSVKWHTKEDIVEGVSQKDMGRVIDRLDLLQDSIDRLLDMCLVEEPEECSQKDLLDQ